MSRHGPPGGYPGQPPDPYEPQQPYPQQPYGGGPPPEGYPPPRGRDPYGQPADPWQGGGGQGGGWGDLTGAQPPYRPGPQDPQTAYQQPYREPTTYQSRDEPPPPPRRRRTGLVVTLVLLLVLIVGGGVYATLNWVGGSDDTAGDSGALGTVPTGTPGPSGSPEGDGEAVDNRIGLGAVVAEADDCLVNDGSDEAPEMRIVACDDEAEPPAYQVLSRFDEHVQGGSDQEWDQAAQQLCADTEGYELHYRFRADDAADSFVLCLAEQ